MTPSSCIGQGYLLSTGTQGRGSDRETIMPAGSATPVKRGHAPSPEAVKQQWHKWVAVRDAHCAGHPWRYSKHQLAYHYTQGAHRSVEHHAAKSSAACHPAEADKNFECTSGHR